MHRMFIGSIAGAVQTNHGAIDYRLTIHLPAPLRAAHRQGGPGSAACYIRLHFLRETGTGLPDHGRQLLHV